MKLTIALFTALSTTGVLAFTETDERILQDGAAGAVVACFVSALAGIGDTASCCSDDSVDPICSLLKCADLDVSENTVGVREGCTCLQLTPFCTSPLLTMIGAAVPGLDETCDGVNDCCKDEIENDAFKSCTTTYNNENGVQVPDMSAFGIVTDSEPASTTEDLSTNGTATDTEPASTTEDLSTNSTDTDTVPAAASPSAVPVPDDSPEESSDPSSASILVGFLWSGAALSAIVAM